MIIPFRKGDRVWFYHHYLWEKGVVREKIEDSRYLVSSRHGTVDRRAGELYRRSRWGLKATLRMLGRRH